jgi:hypothetical protein
VSVDVTTTQVAQTVGPGLGGWLYTLGQSLPFAVDAVSYAASVVSLLWIRVPFQQSRPNKPVQQHLLVEIRTGLAYLMHHPVLRTLAVLVGGLNFCSQGYPVLLIVRAQELGADPQTIGLLFASGGAGGILGALVAPKLQRMFGVGTLLMLSSWVWVLTWPPFALAPSLGWLAVANAVGWIIVPIQGVTQLSYRLQLIPDVLQGRVNSVFRLIAFGGQPAALLLTGVLVQAVGAPATVWLITAPQLVLVAATTLRGSALRGARPATAH